MGDDHPHTGLEQLGNVIQELVERIAKEEGFKEPKFEVTAGSKKGDNYIGVLHRVKVEGQGQDGRPKSMMSLIVKCQPASAARREQFRSGNFFSRETQFYNEVLPVLQEFQKERGVREESYAPASPKCYHASDILIVEDMCHLDYKLCDRQETLNYQHCSVVLKELARFHAVSLAFKDQKPDEFKALANSLPETFLIPVPDVNFKSILDNTYNKAGKIYRERVTIDDKGRYVKALESFTEGYYQKMVELVDGTKDEPYTVITHGDVWINNFLFKYDKSSNKPERLCLLDFQLLRYASPVTDVCHFLYCCSDKPMRDQHFHQLLKDYYDTLADFVLQLGSDPDKLYPYEAFQDQLKSHGKFGLALAICFVPMMTCEASEVPDFDAFCEDPNSPLGDMFDFVHGNDVTAWERICDVATDMVDLGYIE